MSRAGTCSKGGTHGNVHEVAFGERERAVIEVDDGIALEHVEPLIRFLMDLRRRPTAEGDVHTPERVTASCLVRRGEETYSIGARPRTLGYRCGAYHEDVGVRVLAADPHLALASALPVHPRVAPRRAHVSLSHWFEVLDAPVRVLAGYSPAGEELAFL